MCPGPEVRFCMCNDPDFRAIRTDESQRELPAQEDEEYGKEAGSIVDFLLNYPIKKIQSITNLSFLFLLNS